MFATRQAMNNITRKLNPLQNKPLLGQFFDETSCFLLKAKFLLYFLYLLKKNKAVLKSFTAKKIFNSLG